jgi:pimeloyl-ACP methyl ester carboxylesterase
MKFLRQTFSTQRPSPRLGLLAAAAALALAACGGGTPADPLQPYRNQTLAWTTCDPSILGDDNENTRALWQQLGSRLQCANMRAPMDYSQPSRADISVALLRVSAGQPAQRRGAIAINPGGPGGDGLGMPFQLYGAFTEPSPDMPAEQQQRQNQLLDAFDLIGFSPRGTGASTQLNCASNEVQRSVTLGPAGHATPGFWEDLQYNQRKRSEACLKNPLAPHIHTDATARDLDLMRSLLGDEKLHYIGYSYGTWLGAWYASLFPERTGRMLLDSNMDFSGLFDVNVLDQTVAQQQVFDEVLAPYAARHAQLFNLGSTAEQVRALPATFSPRLQSALQPSISDLLSPNGANALLTEITAAQGLQAVLQTLPANTAQNAVREALEAYDFNPRHVQQSALARQSALRLYSRMEMQPFPGSVFLPSYPAVHMAVICNDTVSNPDPGFWQGISRDYAQKYPLFRGEIDSFSCLYWGGPKVQRPPLSAMSGLDVLLVQTQYDAQTSTGGALRAFSALPAARLIMVEGDYKHGVYPYADRCVDDAVTRYLLGQGPATRQSSCPGHPLAQDASASTKLAAADPAAAQARTWLERYHSAIGRR